MTVDVGFANLLAVAVVALLAPLAIGFVPALRLPAVVLEILAGIALGPHGLGWVEVDLPVLVLSLLGLAFLLFLAGLEIDVSRLRGTALRLSVLGYVVTLAVGLAVGVALDAAGWVSEPLLLAVTLSATSLGLVVPVLKDAGVVGSAVGQTTIAAASVADFAAIVLLTLFFSASEGSTGSRLVLVVAFAALVAATATVLSRAGRSMRLGDVLTRLQDTTAEIRVRACVVLLVAFVWLAAEFGLEVLLGGFLAGAVVGLLDRDASSHPHLRTKLEAIGYGFLVPVFFVSSGLRLDLAGLLEEPSALVRVPVLLLALLVVRGTPALLALRDLGPRATAAVALLQATSLPFVVTAVMIGVDLGSISAVTGTALVVAALLSVLLFPVGALALLRSTAPPSDVDGPSEATLATPSGSRT